MYGNNKESENFRELLNQEYSWPDEFVFKFIVPADKKKQVLKTLPGKDYSERASKKGKYIALTIRLVVSSADEVIDIYQKVGDIDGVISL